jgi:hypothetical protein
LTHARLQLSPDLALPLAVTTQKLAWLGVTGSGKTYGASKLAELLIHAGAQVVVLDPVGVWWGLRLATDGKRPSTITIPIFGGLHGDVPLEVTGGALLADLVVDRALSAVIDLSQFESDADKARFARDFADRFFFRKKAAPSAVHVFLEECQEFVPQNPQKGEERMLHAFTRLQKLGRNFGIGSSYISQRPQEVNKKALNMAQTLFVFRTTGTHERKAIEAWIADKALDEDIANDLPKIATGDCHVWSPEFLKISETVHISAKETFNASATPEVGAAAVTRELAPIDLAKVRAAMAATIEKAKAEDPRELRRQIAELTKQLAAKVSDRFTKAVAPKVVEKFVLKDGQLKQLERVTERAAALIDNAGVMVQTLKEVADAIAAAMRAATSPTIDPFAGRREELPSRAPAGVAPAPPRGPGKPRPAPLTSSNGHVPEGVDRYQADVLTALAKLHALGVVDPPKLHAAALARKSIRSSTWDTKLAGLSKAGLVRYNGNGTLSITVEGLDVIGAQPAASGGELLEGYRAILSDYQQALLQPLLRRGGGDLSREEWATAAGKSRTSSTFDNESAAMIALGVVEIAGPGRVRLAPRLAEWT